MAGPVGEVEDPLGGGVRTLQGAGGGAGGWGGEVDGDAVDGFGGEDDEFAGLEELRGARDAGGIGLEEEL